MTWDMNYKYVLVTEVNGTEVDRKEMGNDLTKAMFAKSAKKEEILITENANIIKVYEEVTPKLDDDTFEVSHSLYLCEGGKFIDIILYVD